MPITPAQISGRYDSMRLGLRQRYGRATAPARRRAAATAAGSAARAVGSIARPSGPSRSAVDVIDAHREHDAIDQHEQRERGRRRSAPGTGEIASAVRRMPCTIHGWRPLSVTIQPAMMATKPVHQACATMRKIPARVEQPPAPPSARRRKRRGDHEEADRQHDAKREEHRQHRRPVRRRHVSSGPETVRSGSWVRTSEAPRGMEISNRFLSAFCVRPGEDVEIAGLAAVPVRLHGGDLDRLMLRAC